MHIILLLCYTTIADTTYAATSATTSTRFTTKSELQKVKTFYWNLHVQFTCILGEIHVGC